MNWLLAVLIVMTAGIALGRSYAAAHTAHQRFTSYRHRTNANLRTWVTKAGSTTLFVIVVGLALLLLYLAAAGR